MLGAPMACNYGVIRSSEAGAEGKEKHGVGKQAADKLPSTGAKERVTTSSKMKKQKQAG